MELLADIFDMAAKGGTLPMQALMLAAIIGLGVVFRKFYKDSAAQLTVLTNKMDVREAAMTQERIQRIAMLMEVIKSDTEAKIKMVNAVDNNTSAIRDLRELVKEQRGFIHEVTQKVAS